MSDYDPLQDLPTVSGAPVSLAPGQRIGPASRYELVAEAGRGGMGVVWRARDLQLDSRPVALKFLPQLLALDELAVQDIKREATAMLDLAHPGIVRLHTLESDGRLLFLVMEYLGGPTLRGVLAARTRTGRGLSPPEARWVLAQVAPALDYAHQRRVLHRDLKPANLLLTAPAGEPLGSRGEELKLVDFGIAYVASTSFTQLTGRSHTSGTLPYMAPEVLLGRAPSMASDVYALGVTLYELVAGHLPFTHGDISRQITDAPPPPLESGDAALDAAVAAALAKDPSERPASAKALLALAQSVADRAQTSPPRRAPRPDPPTPPPPRQEAPRSVASQPRRRRRRFGRFVGLLILAGAVAGGLWQADALTDWWRHNRAGTGIDEQASTPPAQESGMALPAEPASRVASGEPRVPEGWEALDPLVGAGRWARRVRDPRTDIVFLLVEPGSFLMGSPESEEERFTDETQHRVTLTKAFYLGETEVTQAQWQRVMGGEPSQFEGDTLPVEQVSWEECQEFCRKAGTGYRLPTEAEWEYACRAGTTTLFSFGATISTEEANYDGIYTGGLCRRATAPVDGFPGNAWGFRSMHGNVWEWCQDGYGPYRSDSVADPVGALSGAFHVVRGGSWQDSPGLCRSASRLWIGNGDRIHFVRLPMVGFIGLRVAITV